MKYGLIFVLLFSFQTIFAQEKNLVISGYIEDAKSGERLIAASVFEKASMKGTTSNNYG